MKHRGGIGKIAFVLILAALCLIPALAGCGESSPAEHIEWDVTLVGVDGREKIISYDEILDLPSYEGRGGFFSTVGIVNGPYKAKGVMIEDLCELVGGITSSDLVMVSAPDGYAMGFDYDQVMGNIETYDLDLREVPHDELNVLLEYEQDGKTLSDSDGNPFRIAVVGEDKLLTEGHYWVKWVDRIEVKRKAQTG